MKPVMPSSGARWVYRAFANVTDGIVAGIRAGRATCGRGGRDQFPSRKCRYSSEGG